MLMNSSSANQPLLYCFFKIICLAGKTDVEQSNIYCDVPVGTSFIWLSVDLLFLFSYLGSEEVGALPPEEEVEQLTSDAWSEYPLDEVNTSLLSYIL